MTIDEKSEIKSHIREEQDQLSAAYLESELMSFDAGTFSRSYMLAKNFTVSIERGMDKNYRLKGM